MVNKCSICHAKGKDKAMSLGFCPLCGAPGKLRERRLNGNDTCENGHVYASRDALTEPPPPKCPECGERVPRAIEHATVDWIAALIERGWEIRHLRTLGKFAYRSPDGTSGESYETDTLEEFPPAVVESIRDDFVRAVRAPS